MEDLLRDQKNQLEKFGGYVTNYGKASKERRLDVKYLQNRISELSEWWFEFESRNTELQAFAEDHPDQPYFVQDTYNGTLKAYQKHRKRLEMQLEEAARKSAQSTSAPKVQFETAFLNSVGDYSDDDDNESVVEIQNVSTFNLDNVLSIPANTEENPGLKSLKLHLKDVCDIIDSTALLTHDQKSSNGFLVAQTELLKTAWNDFRKKYNDEREKENEQMDFVDLKKIQMQYTTNYGRLTDLKQNKSSSEEQCKLPKLTIPEFSGKATEWFAFITMFDETVHNRNTNKSMKIQFLKSLLKGDAAKMVQHIAPTGENYDACYKILRNRYDNKRILLGKFLDTIILLPKHKNESGEDLKNLHDTVNECMLAIKNIGIQTKYWDPLINHIILKKLASETIKDYELKLIDIRECQSFSDMLKYLESRFLALQAAETKYEKPIFDANAKYEANAKYAKSTEFKSKNEVKKSQCLFCKGEHKLLACELFAKQNVQERINWARTSKLCNNCFSNSHDKSKCTSKFSCKNCAKKHHTLLHIETKNSTSANVVTCPMNELSTVANMANSTSDVLLATALVYSRSKGNELILLRALLDQGSQSSFITENAVQLLGLKKFKISLQIFGIGAIPRMASSYVQLSLQPRFESDFVLECKAIVLDKLTNIQLNDNIIKKFSHLQNIILADPANNSNANIDILLGTVEYGKILNAGLIKGKPNEPIAQQTEFGWIVSGKTSSKSCEISTITNSHVLTIDEQLAKFFDTDDVIETIEPTTEEALCETHYSQTHGLANDGKYIVSLPFK